MGQATREPTDGNPVASLKDSRYGAMELRLWVSVAWTERSASGNGIPLHSPHQNATKPVVKTKLEINTTCHLWNPPINRRTRIQPHFPPYFHFPKTLTLEKGNRIQVSLLAPYPYPSLFQKGRRDETRQAISFALLDRQWKGFGEQTQRLSYMQCFLPLGE